MVTSSNHIAPSQLPAHGLVENPSWDHCHLNKGFLCASGVGHTHLVLLSLSNCAKRSKAKAQAKPPPMAMQEQDDHKVIKAIPAAVSSVLSMIGSLYILGRFWYKKRRRKQSASSTSMASSQSNSPVVAKAQHLDITNELVHVLAWFDLVGALGRCFGDFPSAYHFTCQLQAYVIEFGDLSPVAWNMVMALNLYQWVCRGQDQAVLKRRIKYYVAATLVFVLGIATAALAYDVYEDAVIWCWVSPELNIWKLICLYFWVVGGAIFISILLIKVKLDMKKRVESDAYEEARTAYLGVANSLTIYIVAFIICWLPAIADRGYYMITGHDVLVLNVLHATIVPLQGFVNAFIYGKFHVYIGRKLHLGRKRADAARDSFAEANSPCKDDRSMRSFGTSMIFMTSFDMNWTPFPSNLDNWVPPGKDLYVFSLQHCLAVKHAEEMIRRHLVRINYPMCYRCVIAMAGATMRGNVHDAAVCELVFVNHSDVESGNFICQEVDNRVWSQRSSKKQVVGIPVRYFDASIAFVSCNLSQLEQSSSSTSDVAAAAKSKEEVLEAKHSLVSNLIHSLGMDVDRAGVNFPYLYHHTLLAGNLNYDIDLSDQELYGSIEQAYKAECLRRGTDNAVDNHNHFGLASAAADTPRSKSTSTNRSTRCSSVSSSEDCDHEYDQICEEVESGVAYGFVKTPRDDDGENDEAECDEPDPYPATKTSWQAFLDTIFGPDQAPPSPQTSGPGRLLTRGPRSLRVSRSISGGQGTALKGLHRNPKHVFNDLLAKSQQTSDHARKFWDELLRFDELTQAVQNREVFCGFEEPPIQFLPSFPRKAGKYATFSLLPPSKWEEYFRLKHGGMPSYKDRILSHSLPDTRRRLRNVKYWLCEDIMSSTHKPVCSVYELEIDRLHAFKLREAKLAGTRAGLRALKDQRDVKKYRIKLINLDATIWSYQRRSGSLSHGRLRRMISSASLDTSANALMLDPRCQGGSFVRSYVNHDESLSSSASEDGQEEGAPKTHLPRSLSRGRSFFNVGRRSPQSLDSPFQCSPPFGSGPLLHMMQLPHQDLVPVEPLKITTVFPLPSEDVFALQRKVYEVAIAVNSGFHASVHNDGDANENEEAQLAYTNFRTATWGEAFSHGITHSAITRAINGVLHVAIKITGDKQHGGEGILCIPEEVFVSKPWASPTNSESDSDCEEMESSTGSTSTGVSLIPFDVMLTWKGKHVGYLHGDMEVTTRYRRSDGPK